MGGQGHADEARRSCKVEPNLVLSARSVNNENTLRACTASNGLEYLGLGLPMSFYALTRPTARPSSPHVFPTTLSGMTNRRIFVCSTPSPHAHSNRRPCRITTPASSRPSRRVRKGSRAHGGRYSSGSGRTRIVGGPVYVSDTCTSYLDLRGFFHVQRAAEACVKDLRDNPQKRASPRADATATPGPV